MTHPTSNILLVFKKFWILEHFKFTISDERDSICNTICIINIANALTMTTTSTTTTIDRLKGWPYILSEGKLIDIPSKHGTRWQDGGVSWRHDSSRNSTKPKEGNVHRTEILQNNWEDHVCFLLGLGIWKPICSLIPVCEEKTTITTESPHVVYWDGKSICWSCNIWLAWVQWVLIASLVTPVGPWKPDVLCVQWCSLRITDNKLS